jgi:predicted RNA binding protein with dsRBD fold (UPF0201 family)
VRVTVSTPVKVTEDPARVEEAARKLFPDLEGGVADGRFTATTRDLRPLRKRIWELRIIDTARGQVLHGTPTGAARSTRFRLAKQAALAGKVSFPPAPHALGDLEVAVEIEDGDPWVDIDSFALWLCPETKDGEIVGPVLP